MRLSRDSLSRHFSSRAWVVLFVFAISPSAFADEPLTLRQQFTGNTDFFATGGAVARDGADGDSNLDHVVMPASVAVNAVPSSASLVKAYLYWAGSVSPSTATCDEASFDTAVELQPPGGESATVEADVCYCSASPTQKVCRADISSRISAMNGSYTVDGFSLTLSNLPTDHGSFSVVLIYQESSLAFRKVSLIDGIVPVISGTNTVTLSDIRSAKNPTGKLTWYTLDGDLGGTGTEQAQVKGSAAATALTLSDAINPSTNPMNHTINTTNPTQTTSYGVDIDSFDISAALAEGDTSITITSTAGTDKWWIGYQIVAVDVVGLTIDDVTATEGHSGTKNFVFTVTKSGSTSTTTSVDFATSAVTATAGVDYISQSGTLTFDPLETTKTITIAVSGDTTAEPNETFAVSLSGASNAIVADSSGTGTIVDDDTPTITAASPLSRTAGSAGTTSTIATVSDSGDAAGTLTVTATSVPSGITVGAITNTNGTITANVAASCSATAGANSVTLQVQDSESATSTASLTVNVTSNPAPTLGDYPDATMNAGASATVTPTASPSDNGTVIVTASASSGFTGSLSADSTTGVVSISNPNSGTYTITVVATDNCSATGTKTFTLTVNAGLATPQGVSATAVSQSEITVTWMAVAGATSYEIWRGANPSAPYVTVTGTSYNDTAVAAATTYFYRVRARNSTFTSSFSAMDAATTVSFADDPLSTGTVVKAMHIDELRTAVLAFRSAAGVGTTSFTDNPLTAGTVIKAAHVTQLRSALDEARAAVGLSPLVYTDVITAASTIAKAVHVQELRNGVK